MTQTGTLIETTITLPHDAVVITTDFNETLGYTTQIHGGELNGKRYVANTRKRANYNHTTAVKVALKGVKNRVPFWKEETVTH